MQELEEVFQIQQNIAPMNRVVIILQAQTDECFVCKDTVEGLIEQMESPSC
jgi:glycerol-3-phosphate responsive antiterminator